MFVINGNTINETMKNHVIPPIKPMNKTTTNDECWQERRSKYCYLYNVAYNAILDYFNNNCEPFVSLDYNHSIENPQIYKNASNSGQENVETKSKISAKAFNRDSESRQGIKIRSFANFIASQPNIVRITWREQWQEYHQKIHQVKKSKVEASKEYKDNKLTRLERRKMALKAKQRLLKAKNEWRKATHHTKNAWYKKERSSNEIFHEDS